MHPFELFESICRTMSAPDFYPHLTTAVERRDTHVSAVFLTGDWVYKLKKPVNFGFLDFRTLRDRKIYCEKELDLNRRLSRGIYREVVAIYQHGEDTFSLTPPGRVVEYAVKMRQLPDEASLKQGLKHKRIFSSHMAALGKVLAEFYAKSARGQNIDGYGHPDVIAVNMEENFRQLDPFVITLLDREKWECICQVSRSFLKNHPALFAKRIETGRIRDGHGDLRTDHVYFHKEIQIIDCIEFNDRFRYGDAVLDLSFLHMDMEHSGHSKLSRDFLNAYALNAQDPGLYALLDFYASYRAVVRLKISCLRLEDASPSDRPVLEEDIRKYMEQAYHYAVRYSRPTLWIVFGLPATGKSSLSELMGDALSLSVIQSDRVRKESLSDKRKTVAPFGRGLYRKEMRQRTYARIFAEAQEIMKQGKSVILDATFSHRKWRDQARQLAEDIGSNVIFVECTCDTKVIRARLKQRESSPGLSDARIEHLSDMVNDFEVVDELPARLLVQASTDLPDQPIQSTLIQILSDGYACRCAQINAILST